MTRKNRMKELAREKTLVRKRERGNKKKSGGGGEEEKNTMLLTVIAVATLLVAVVGATFAYFSLSAESESSTTGTITTPKIGTATITPGATKLYLTLTPENMSDTNKGKTYYATTEQSGIGGTATPIAIAGAKLEGAQNEDEYSCKTTVKVTAEGTMLEQLESGWAKLSLTGSGATSASDIDLSSLKDSGDGETYTGTATLTAGADGSVTVNDIVSAVLSFNNTTAEQNNVAGKSLTVNIEITGGECTLQTGD